MTKMIDKMLAGKFFQKMCKNPFLIMDEIISPIVRKWYMSGIKVNKDKILFTTFNGSYSCNPKAIANEIIKRKLPWELVWATKTGTSQSVPNYFKSVIQGSPEFYQEAAASKLWICNGITMTYLGAFKKKEQKLIQTWHGAIGIKRFDTNKDYHWIRNIKHDGKITDYCISNSTFENNLYKSTFWKNTTILTLGHARNDILFKENTTEGNSLKESIKNLLNIPNGVKIAMYAPTFRDDKSLVYYNIDYSMLRNALVKKFGGEWVILTRLHSKMRKKAGEFNFNTPEFVIDATGYSDIQELLLVTDVGITDYSSWICEFLFTGKPGFLFSTDLGSYNKERGLLFPIEEFPCSMAETNEELCKNILSFDELTYREKVKEFLTKKGAIDDGQAAERIVDKLEELMNVEDY